MKKEILHTQPVSNLAFHWIGAGILFLNKIRHSITGYNRPRDFKASEIQKNIDHDLRVTGMYEEALKEYINSPAPLKDKRVLELGPGPDLGNGMILRAMGVKHYHGFDILPLINQTKETFYKQLATQLQRLDLLAEIETTALGDKTGIAYTVDKNFDLTQLAKEEIDLVVSNAAFEHFDDIEITIKQIGELLPSGGVFLADVDLQTHTRWIREKDPLNIYRYSKGFYGLFKFLGSPNRKRPSEYKALLKKHGFKKIKLIPRIVLNKDYVEATKNSLAKPFKTDPNLEMMDLLVLATKK